MRDFLKLKLNPTRGTLTSLRKKGPIYPAQGLHFSPCSLSLVDFELLINSLNVSVILILVSLVLALIDCLRMIRILRKANFWFDLVGEISFQAGVLENPHLWVSLIWSTPRTLDAQFTDRAPAYKL